MVVVDGVEVMDVRETARLVGRSPETVRRWIWSGRLSAVRHGNKLLVTREAVEQLTSGPVANRLTLLQWAADVERQRRSGALSEAHPRASAADVVLDERAEREAN